MKKQCKFNLNEEEYEQADNLAKSYNLTITKLAKFFVLNATLPQTPNEKEQLAEIKKTKSQLKMIGINLNQIARRVNARSIYAKDSTNGTLISNEEILNGINETKAMLQKIHEGLE